MSAVNCSALSSMPSGLWSGWGCNCGTRRDLLFGKPFPFASKTPRTVLQKAMFGDVQLTRKQLGLRNILRK